MVFLGGLVQTHEQAHMQAHAKSRKPKHAYTITHTHSYNTRYFSDICLSLPCLAGSGAKERLIRLLLCFNPLWLRIGVETVFGEILFLSSNLDVVGISRFIASRLVHDPAIASKFSHPTVPHLYLNGWVWVE